MLASLLISSGALADRIGRRRVFRLGLAVFGAASAACALAPAIGALVAARAVQGVGGSMLSPVALAIVVNVMTEPKERARAIGVWAAVFGASMAAGPIVGGALVSEFGWRSVFWINVPIVAVALALTTVFVPESRAERPRGFDGPGQLLLIVMVGGSVAVLIEGPHIGWDSPAAIAGCVTTAVAAAAFIRIGSRRAEPLVDPRLFRRPPFASAVVGAVAVFVALSATLLLTTLYLQDARGMTPLAAGTVTLPMAIAATVCAPLSGMIVGRFGARPPLLLAGGFITAGGLCLVGTGDHADALSLSLSCLLVGVGFGFANAPITDTAVSGLPPARAGVAGGITSTARQLGSALGIAVAGGVIADAPPALLAQASRPGWLLVAGCGLIVLVVALAAPAAGVRRRPQTDARPDGDTETARAFPGGDTETAHAFPGGDTETAKIRAGAEPGRR
ncbi:MFS transporter [Planomonospora algeriensis]